MRSEGRRIPPRRGDAGTAPGTRGGPAGACGREAGAWGRSGTGCHTTSRGLVGRALEDAAAAPPQWPSALLSPMVGGTGWGVGDSNSQWETGAWACQGDGLPAVLATGSGLSLLCSFSFCRCYRETLGPEASRGPQERLGRRSVSLHRRRGHPFLLPSPSGPSQGPVMSGVEE